MLLFVKEEKSGGKIQIQKIFIHVNSIPCKLTEKVFKDTLHSKTKPIKIRTQTQRNSRIQSLGMSSEIYNRFKIIVESMMTKF